MTSNYSDVLSPSPYLYAIGCLLAYARAAYQVLLDSQVQPTRVQERAAWIVI